MENSNDHWFIKDKESRYVYMNNSSVNYFNAPKNFDIEGKLDKEIPIKSSQELWQEFVEHDQKVIEENKQITSIEIHYYGKGNIDTPKPQLCDKSPLYDNKNNCIGVVGRGVGIEAPALLYYMLKLNRSVINFDAQNEVFTKKEMEIVFWSQQNLSAKEIAKRLNISHRTVENRLYVMYQKADVHTQEQFIEYCKATGLDQYIPSDFIRKGVQLLA
ncbi:helix-turn-helix transcriptional regulator [Sodalis praecaptivus]|uniref:helix-turn-helix transcriptional regulator n=1 Tax=Sodalis praecaptivus TaxID=1239307 RepID=UPI0031F9DD02